jgi:outer membrane immunogenic protein
MRKIIFTLAGTTALFATSASAAGLTGPRVEVRGGWDRTTLDLSYDDGFDAVSGEGHKDGFDLGGEVGYDAKIGSAVIAGAYAGVEFATTKQCGEVYGGDRACLKLGRNFTLGARIGAKVAPKVMLYAKGGYSNGRLSATYRNDEDSTLNFSTHANRDGFHLGAGVEMTVGSYGYVRAEYVRTNYNDYRYADPDFSVTLDGHRDQVLFGTGLRF